MKKNWNFFKLLNFPWNSKSFLKRRFRASVPQDPDLGFSHVCLLPPLERTSFPPLSSILCSGHFQVVTQIGNFHNAAPNFFIRWIAMAGSSVEQSRGDNFLGGISFMVLGWGEFGAKLFALSVVNIPMLHNMHAIWIQFRSDVVSQVLDEQKTKVVHELEVRSCAQNLRPEWPPPSFEGLRRLCLSVTTLSELWGVEIWSVRLPRV